MEESLKKSAVSNIIYAFVAQIISITLSIFMSLVIPKLLGVNDFSYWQLFLFYLSYVGFFHLGITDGMYLKIGGKKFQEINKKELSSLFYFLLIIQLLFFVALVFFDFILVKNSLRKLIMIYVGLYMIIANLNWFLGYIFQGTNKVKIYSVSVMIDKLLFLIFLIVSAISKFKKLDVYLPIYISTTSIALMFSIYNARSILLTKPMNFMDSLKLSYKNAKIGINLTLASISSLLILGIGRFMIDKNFGIESFGKFSFALSLTNFFLLFIAQVSIVLFPTLRQVDQNVAKKLFTKFNRYLDSILPIIFVLYIPIKLVLSFWLPQYAVSLNYLAYLLPICIFDGKMQMISNTYFKVLRKERQLLLVNIITVIISLLFSIIGVYLIKNIIFIIYGMLIAIAFRSIASEIYLSKSMELNSNIKAIVFDLVFSIAFILINQQSNYFYSFIFIIIIFILFVLITKSYEVYNEIFCKLKKNRK